jgi:hypothetical protein
MTQRHAYEHVTTKVNSKQKHGDALLLNGVSKDTLTAILLKSCYRKRNLRAVY